MGEALGRTGKTLNGALAARTKHPAARMSAKSHVGLKTRRGSDGLYGPEGAVRSNRDCKGGGIVQAAKGLPFHLSDGSTQWRACSDGYAAS